MKNKPTEHIDFEKKEKLKFPLNFNTFIVKPKLDINIELKEKEEIHIQYGRITNRTAGSQLF